MSFSPSTKLSDHPDTVRRPGITLDFLHTHSVLSVRMNFEGPEGPDRASMFALVLGIAATGIFAGAYRTGQSFRMPSRERVCFT